MHKSTNLIPISLVILLHPPGPATVSQPSALISDSYDDTDPRWLSLRLQGKIATLQAKLNLWWRKRAEHYRRHYNAKVLVEGEFVPNQWVLIHKVPLTGKANVAEKMAKVSYNKLDLQKFGPFQTSYRSRIQSCSAKKEA